MSDNELLLAISGMMDRKFKSELQPLKSSLHILEEEVKIIKIDLNSVKEDVQNLKEGQQALGSEIQKIKLFQQNQIVPRLDTIEL